MNREARMRLKAEADRRREEGSQVVAQAPPVMSMAEAVLAAPKRTAEKPPKPAKGTAPPVIGIASALIGTPANCCACNGDLFPSDMVQQTKRGRWRHVTCPARPAKEKRPSVTADQRDGRVEKQGRLPHGTIFHAVYDDELKCWTGGFTIDGKEIAIVRSGLFRLATDCDRLYRQSAWKKKVDNEPAKG